jgi:hypothetical protein
VRRCVALVGARCTRVIFLKTAAPAGAKLGTTSATAARDLIPSRRYRDAVASIAFLERAVGFETLARYDDGDRVSHVQLRAGSSVLMAASASRAMFDMKRNVAAVGSECHVPKTLACGSQYETSNCVM